MRRWARRILRGLAWVLAVMVALVVHLTVMASVYLATVRADTVPVPPLEPNGHRISAGGLTTHYVQWGSTGTPIVLVHGFLESTYVWQRVGPLLAAQGHRVYAIDVRGYGYTQRLGPYTLSSDTDQLAAFLAALHLDAGHGGAPVLVGHSSGAAIIADLARQHPSSAAAIVLLDGDGTPYGVGPAWIHALFVDPYATALIRVGTHDPAFAEGIYHGDCGPGCPPFDANAWVRPLRVPGAESALKQILAKPLIGLTYDQEREIRVRSAVVYGTLDDSMSAADARDTAARLHADVLVPIPGAHHLPMLSDPAATAAAISRVTPPE